jgi:hypothetical protein
MIKVLVSHLSKRKRCGWTSRALYVIAAELNTTELVRDASERIRTATTAMLEAAADAKFAADLPMVALMCLNALVGPTRALLEGRASPKKLRAFRAQLLLLNNAYLPSVAVAARRNVGNSGYAATTLPDQNLWMIPTPTATWLRDDAGEPF